MDKGNLEVQVIGGDIAIPVPEATIRVINQQTGEFKTGATDENGNSPVFTLPAPLVTVTGDTTTDSPFSLYTVEVSKPGYTNMTVKNVKIFPNQDHYQTLNIFPIAEAKTAETETILPSNPIASYPEKIPEDPIKTIPLPKTKVLPRVIVPEYIIVHDGAPSSTTAKNYKVPYKDYLKAVATNEIYSTWHQEAIIANVLAINSFTLNRVFTEWYPSNGYSGFTVTSVSNYDQAWAPNKAIPKNISDVVDQYYDKYIKYNDNQQPYFSQYWNGTGTNRPGWLSQNGSQQLALQGKAYLQILKNYYGNDITINNAPVISGLPSSYPGTAMRKTDCSAAIKQMQIMLNTIRKNYPGIPAISNPNGYFDNETDAAVKKFQEVFKLTKDGIMGPTTWYQISLVYTAVVGLNKAQGGAAAPQLDATSPNDCFAPTTPPSGNIANYVVKAGDTLYSLANKHCTSVDAIKSQNNLTSNALSIGQQLTISDNCSSETPGETPNTNYIVKAGDTLYSIAKEFCTTVDAIKMENNLISNTLSIDQQLKITNQCSNGNTPGETTAITHIVKSGDTLYSLANKHCTTVDAIKTQNNLTSNALSIGQQLTITDQCGNASTPNTNVSHTIKAGDTLYGLATKYCTTVDAIKSQNNLTSNTLTIGKVLTITDKCSRSDQQNNRAIITYVVKSGDTLYSLANKHCTTVDAIKNQNNIASNALSIGQQLTITDQCGNTSTPNKNYKIIIDPGHGGSDPGSSGNGIIEKNKNLEISLYMRDKLAKCGVEAKMTRETDTTLDPTARVTKIKSLYPPASDVIVISNHINAGGGEGAETIYPLRDKKDLAQNIADGIATSGQNIRRVYQRPGTNNQTLDYYYILRDTKPNQAVLIEYGFLDNAKDAQKLKNNWRAMVDGAVDGIIKKLGINCNQGNTSGETTAITHVVKSGDTLYSLANKHCTTVDAIKTQNNLTSNALSIGQQLTITDQCGNTSTPNTNVSHTIKAGDTLYSLATKYCTTVDAIKSQNNLTSNALSIGQQLIITNKCNDTSAPSKNITHIIKAGDTLYSLATKYCTTVDAIKSQNNLTSNALSIGQQLIITNKC